MLPELFLRFCLYWTILLCGLGCCGLVNNSHVRNQANRSISNQLVLNNPETRWHQEISDIINKRDAFTNSGAVDAEGATSRQTTENMTDDMTRKIEDDVNSTIWEGKRFPLPDNQSRSSQSNKHLHGPTEGTQSNTSVFTSIIHKLAKREVTGNGSMNNNGTATSNFTTPVSENFTISSNPNTTSNFTTPVPDNFTNSSNPNTTSNFTTPVPDNFTNFSNPNTTSNFTTPVSDNFTNSSNPNTTSNFTTPVSDNFTNSSNPNTTSNFTTSVTNSFSWTTANNGTTGFSNFTTAAPINSTNCTITDPTISLNDTPPDFTIDTNIPYCDEIYETTPQSTAFISVNQASWPSGNFSLIVPSASCPTKDNFTKAGSLRDVFNLWSSVHSPTHSQLSVCNRLDSALDYIEWPAGRYCVLGYGSGAKCPPGLEAKNINISTAPYCCSSGTNNTLLLPFDSPFSLFPVESCPEVANMMVDNGTLELNQTVLSICIYSLIPTGNAMTDPVTKTTRSIPNTVQTDNGKAVWPRGNFTLFVPVGECPQNGNFVAAKNSSNMYEIYDSLKGSYTLCERIVNGGLPTEQSLQPWPNGSYCVLASNNDSSCPLDLSSENVTFVRSPKRTDLVVPLCCHIGDAGGNEIIWPSDSPFYLFQGDSQNCEKVENMKTSNNTLLISIGGLLSIVPSSSKSSNIFKNVTGEKDTVSLTLCLHEPIMTTEKSTAQSPVKHSVKVLEARTKSVNLETKLYKTMVRRQRLTTEQRLRAVGMMEAGLASSPLGGCESWVSSPCDRQYPGPGEKGLAFQRLKAIEFPKYQGIWMGPVLPNLIIHCPEAAKTILKTSEPKSSERFYGVYHLGLLWLGKGLLMSNGAKWARNRRLLTPAFHFDILQPYVEIYNDRVEVFMDKIKKFSENGGSFEVFSQVTLCTLDIILRCAFSYKNDVQIRGEKHPYVQAVSELNELWIKRFLKPYVYIDWLYLLTSDGRKFKKNCDFVHLVSEEIIARRRETMKNSQADTRRSGKYLDFLDILLTARDENGEGLSQQDIRDEVDTFLFEGHDTTTSSISWVIHSLANAQEHQQKVHEELDELFSGRDTDRVLWEDLQKVPYLTMCIKESMRLNTPVPFIQRQLSRDLEIDGKILPAGTLVSVDIYNIHTNPAVWEDPLTYRPERFLTENIIKKDSHAFLPFSAGPRNCIGQNFAMHEQKVILARLFHRFHFDIDSSHIAKRKNVLVMKSENGVHVIAEPRF